jgi:hypothetical protein
MYPLTVSSLCCEAGKNVSSASPGHGQARVGVKTAHSRDPPAALASRLRDAGIVSKVDYQIPSRGGRPPNRWHVNPRLTTTLPPGNPGNIGNLPGW